MKNKAFIAIFLLICLSLAMIACEPPEPTPEPDPTLTVDLNEMLAKDYTSLKVELKTVHEMGVLMNVYDVKETDEGVSVDYSCQSFTELDISGTENGLITTATGNVVYKNGEIVSESGDSVLYTLPQSVRPRLDLSGDNMRNIKESDGTVTADIKDPAKLILQGTSATDMKLEVKYEGEAIRSIIISYKKDATPVTLTLTLN